MRARYAVCRGLRRVTCHCVAMRVLYARVCIDILVRMGYLGGCLFKGGFA